MRVNLSLKKRARFFHKLIYLSLDKSLTVAITYSNLTIFYYVQTNYFQITISELVFIAGGCQCQNYTVTRERYTRNRR